MESDKRVNKTSKSTKSRTKTNTTAKTNTKKSVSATKKVEPKKNSDAVTKKTVKIEEKKPVKRTVKKTVQKVSEEKQDTFSAKLNLILPTLILVVFFALLIVSAAYAYFMVNATNDFKTTQMNVSAGNIGSVAFNSGNANLKLDLTAAEMLQLGEDVTYYASNSGATTTETSEELGSISVAGEGVFDCKYTLEIKSSAKSEDTNMYNKFQNMATKSEGQIVLTLFTQDGEEIYDFNTENLFVNDVISYKGEANGIKDGSPETLKAQLKLVNKTGVVQDNLKGADITLSLTVTSFECEIVG